MAGAEQTTTSIGFGDKILTVSVAGLTLDGDRSTEVDLQTEMLNSCKIFGYPKSVTMQAALTAGTTDTIEVNLIGSNITTVFAYTTGGDDEANILSCVNAIRARPVGETDLDPYRFWKIVCQTVGHTGNTITATAVFQWE